MRLAQRIRWLALMVLLGGLLVSKAAAQTVNQPDASPTAPIEEPRDGATSPPLGSALAPNDAASRSSHPLGRLAPASQAPTAPVAPIAPIAPIAPVAPSAPSADAVLATVEGLRGLRSWTVIPFAHLRRGKRHVVIAWPAIDSSGRLVDATVVGICLIESADGELLEKGRRWVVREAEASRTALQQALGGSTWDVVGRVSGAPLNDLGPELGRRGSTFAKAVSRGDRVTARHAAQGFAAFLPVDRVMLENDVARLLWLAATHRGGLRHVRTSRQGDEALIVLHVMRGRSRLRTIEAHARPERPGSARWVIYDFSE